MRFVLIHGAWCRGLHWGRVPALLRQMGHEVLAPDLPETAPATGAPGDVSLTDYADAVLDHCAQGDILVGHSMGGMAISAAAARQPLLFAHLIYVTAFLPVDGQSLLDIKKTDGRSLVDAVRDGAPGTTQLIGERAKGEMMHDVPGDLALWALAQMRQQPNRPQTDAFDMVESRFRLIPKTYLCCRQDRVLSARLQLEMANNTPNTHVSDLDSGHFPQLSQPHALARFLAETAGDVPGDGAV